MLGYPALLEPGDSLHGGIVGVVVDEAPKHPGLCRVSLVALWEPIHLENLVFKTH